MKPSKATAGKKMNASGNSTTVVVHGGKAPPKGPLAGHDGKKALPGQRRIFGSRALAMGVCEFMVGQMVCVALAESGSAYCADHAKA